MITTGHVAGAYVAYFAKMKRFGFGAEDIYKGFAKMIPWVVLPDGIRNFIGARQAGHHEVCVNGGVSWMEYPTAYTLKEMTKENAKDLVKTHVEADIPKLPDGKNCDIGEYTDFVVFNQHNIAHPEYHLLAMHLGQDDKLDHILRDYMVDVTDRYNDVYVVRHSGQKLNGKELRKQIAIFEELAFLYMAGQIYKTTGTILNKRWFEDVVYPALKKAYPEEMADSAFGFMTKVLDKLDERICALNFDITEEDRQTVIITDDLEGVLSTLYVWIYWASYEQL